MHFSSRKSKDRHLTLLYKNKSSDMNITLVTESDETRNSWFKAVKLAMDSLSPKENKGNNHVLQMTTFFEPAKCSQCHQIIMGSFYQGYRCLRCLANLHKQCIAKYSCLNYTPSKYLNNNEKSI